MEVLDTNVMPREAQRFRTDDVITRRFVWLFEKGDEHPKPVCSKLPEIGGRGVATSQEILVVDPPSIHRKRFHSNSSNGSLSYQPNFPTANLIAFKVSAPMGSAIVSNPRIPVRRKPTAPFRLLISWRNRARRSFMPGFSRFRISPAGADCLT